jgi:hypothetical protein
VSLLDAFWHLTNLFAPAWAVAALLAMAVKLVWRREAAALRWQRLWLWGAAGGSLAIVLSLVWLGRDGKMLGYALLLAGISAPQWWLIKR